MDKLGLNRNNQPLPQLSTYSGPQNSENDLNKVGAKYSFIGTLSKIMQEVTLLVDCTVAYSGEPHSTGHWLQWWDSMWIYTHCAVLLWTGENAAQIKGSRGQTMVGWAWGRGAEWRKCWIKKQLMRVNGRIYILSRGFAGKLSTHLIYFCLQEHPGLISK